MKKQNTRKIGKLATLVGAGTFAIYNLFCPHPINAGCGGYGGNSIIQEENEDHINAFTKEYNKDGSIDLIAYDDKNDIVYVDFGRNGLDYVILNKSDPNEKTFIYPGDKGWEHYETIYLNALSRCPDCKK